MIVGDLLYSFRIKIFMELFGVVSCILIVQALFHFKKLLTTYVLDITFNIFVRRYVKSMELFILRHGEAGQRSSQASDRTRPLTTAGKGEIVEIAKALKIIGLKFDVIVTSPLKRAYDTAMIVSDIFKIGNRVQTWNELAPEGKRTEVYRKISELREDYTVLIVGHQPLLGEIINDMIHKQKSSPSNLLLKKAGIVRIRLLSKSNIPKGELRWLLSPRILKNIYKKSPK
jgi:phosphohistidine phosphatase